MVFTERKAFRACSYWNVVCYIMPYEFLYEGLSQISRGKVAFVYRALNGIGVISFIFTLVCYSLCMLFLSHGSLNSAKSYLVHVLKGRLL